MTTVSGKVPGEVVAMLGEPPPPFTLKGIDGKAYALANLRGRFVVIHFGTSW